MSPPLEHSLDVHRNKLKPSFFVVRNTGEVVPLIAVDELLPGTDIPGVPRSIALKDTIGMLNLGIQRHPGAYYQLSTPPSSNPNSSPNELAARSKIPLQESKKQPPIINLPKPSAPASTSPLKPAGVAAPPAHTTAAASHARQNNQQERNETALCRHWCAHGICKWGQACRYRHIMPMTTSGLREAGLSDWPGWYRSLNPGYFAGEVVHGHRHHHHPSGNHGRRGRARPCREVCCAGGTGNGGGNGDAGWKGKVEKELGEQALQRLRGLGREVDGKSGAEEKLSESLVLEQAQARDTRGWEEESNDEEEGHKARQRAAEQRSGKEKLVDV
ncbi:hypothetical protein B0O99DRAFT_32417 [Bisporella sp. PMI_857]|nr:hypothetical protein B0O99DRAFT_32417 [Bisporella sp. PMI_857]